MKPSDFHEIKESEIPKHTMTFDKHATGAAVDQKHYQTAEKEPIEVMQMYFTAQELYGFCKGNALKYILRSRFKGTELKEWKRLCSTGSGLWTFFTECPLTLESEVLK